MNMIEIRESATGGFVALCQDYSKMVTPYCPAVVTKFETLPALFEWLATQDLVQVYMAKPMVKTIKGAL